MHTWRYVSEAIAACSWAVPEYWGVYAVAAPWTADRTRTVPMRSDTGLSSRAARVARSAPHVRCRAMAGRPGPRWSVSCVVSWCGETSSRAFRTRRGVRANTSTAEYRTVVRRTLCLTLAPQARATASDFLIPLAFWSCFFFGCKFSDANSTLLLHISRARFPVAISCPRARSDMVAEDRDRSRATIPAGESMHDGHRLLPMPCLNLVCCNSPDAHRRGYQFSDRKMPSVGCQFAGVHPYLSTCFVEAPFIIRARTTSK